VFPHNCEDLNILTIINIAASSNPTFDSGHSKTAYESESNQQPEEPPERPHMIGDFDGSSNALWTLFRDEAKSHDDARINTLKDDMEGVLIFVRCPFTTVNLVILMHGSTGRFIFRCPHCICT